MILETAFGPAIPIAVCGDALVCCLPMGDRVIRAGDAVSHEAFVAEWRSLGGDGQRLQFADGSEHHPFPR